MAENSTRIDPDAARAQNARLRSSGTRFNDAVQKMQAAAAAHEGCWGNDQFGAAFAKSYKPGADQELTDAGVVNGNLTGAPAPIDASIANLEQTDQNNANSL